MTKQQALQQIKELEAYIASIPVHTEEDELWEKIQPLINNSNSSYKNFWKRSFEGDVELGISVTKNAITIYLPSANTEWFFDVMSLAQEICKIERWEIYPNGKFGSIAVKVLITILRHSFFDVCYCIVFC